MARRADRVLEGVRGVRWVPLAAATVVLAGCGSSGEPLDVPGDDGALAWGGDPDGRTGVVLAHGASYDAASWEEQAEALADAGASVVAIEELDGGVLRAAVEGLRADGATSVAVVGASAGADLSLRTAAEDPGYADRLVLLSANEEVAGLGDEPKLFVAGEDEPLAGVSTALAVGPEDEVLLVPGDAHAQGLFDTDDGDRVLAAVLEGAGVRP